MAANRSPITVRPRAKRSDRDATAVGGRPYCTLIAAPPRQFQPGVRRERLELIVVLEPKWVNGTTLHYYFYAAGDAGGNGSPAAGEAQVVRDGFKAWADLGLGLRFEEVTSPTQAEVRVGFVRGDGYWSYLGRQILDEPKSKRTMNFGWNLAQQADGLDTAIHEIGHTLGFPHEHQNPKSGIVWDEDAVYSALALPPNNWSRETTYYNIIRKISPDQVQGSTWDPNSVMHYPFEAGLIKEPAQYSTGVNPDGGLSARDQEWAQTFYPTLTGAAEPLLGVGESVRLLISPGEQKNFRIQPPSTRYYEIQTLGASDTVMVLFEDEDGTERYLTADDDSGEDHNAHIRIKLFEGHRYKLRVRMYFSERPEETAVVLF